MSGRKKTWFDGKVVWVRLPDDPEEESETDEDDLWPDLMLAMHVLTDRQRFVVECRYGLRPGMAGSQMELEEIGQLMGISYQAVQNIERDSLKKLQGVVSNVEREA